MTSLLAGLMGRSYGLPQQSGSSDVLAEAYLSVVEPRLLRRGLAVWRYNDDFRIAVDSWSEALNAVDALERECRAIGLALNDLKTVIRKVATYQEGLRRRAEVLEEISEEAEVDLTDVVQGPYDDDIVIEPEKNEVIVGAAQIVVAEWMVLQEKMLDPDPESALTQDEQEKRLALTDLLRWALSVLQSEKTDTNVLAACGQILRTEQTLTPLVARYLSKATDPATTIAWFEDFLGGNPYLTPWQAWWMAPALRGVEGSYADGSAQRSWLESVWTDSACPEPVKAGVAFTVAQKGLADAKALMQVFDSMTDTGRPFVARAVGAVAAADDWGPRPSWPRTSGSSGRSSWDRACLTRYATSAGSPRTRSATFGSSSRTTSLLERHLPRPPALGGLAGRLSASATARPSSRSRILLAWLSTTPSRFSWMRVVRRVRSPLGQQANCVEGQVRC